MPITYIYHDCFLVSLPEAQLIFDYWKCPESEDPATPRFLADLDPDKPTYIFVSHSHKDHYNPVIFDWYPHFRSIRYIISRDVWRRCRHICSETSVYAGQKVSPDAVTVLDNLSLYEDSLLRIIAFPSTDIGNAYLIETKRPVTEQAQSVEEVQHPLRIFHAGDLNAWVWFQESTEQEIHKALGDFNACLLPLENYLNISSANRDSDDGTIDVAFFPVDPRLGEGHDTGARIFRERFRIARFIPMHYCLPRE